MKLNQFYLKFLFFSSFLCPIVAFAQPANDQCEQAIEIVDLENFCSNAGNFSNENATPTGFNGDGELSSTGRDVWFRFTAIASHVTITIRGLGTGGTLTSPEVQLLVDNNCGNEFQILDSALSGFADIVELNKGGLIPGVSYLFRVQGANGDDEGTFQLCINNFFPPQSPGSDIDIAAVLCDKSSFVVQEIGGAGLDDDEADGTCLDVNFFFPTEQSSTWFTWIAANDGTLEFTLDPLNPSDDIDFVLFELPNGINNADGKIVLRCMATSCEGPTGLNATSTDLEEDANCDPGEDGFVRAIDMQTGRAYGLLINNFTESGNGFTVEFGGTGEFQTPDAVITPPESNQVCLGAEVTFDGSSSSFTDGEIVSYEWIFGLGAEPATAMGVNPGPVSYNIPGEKTIVLTVTSALGCKVTEVIESFITVDSCCLDVAILSDFTEIISGESANLETNVSEAIGEVTYLWSPANILSCTDCPNPTITPTEDVVVAVMIMDEQGCEATDTLAVEVRILIEDVSIPSAFSPDFDGTNDRFTLLGGGPEDRILSLQIYTRWGNLVYEVENIQLGNENNAGWDGNYKGERLQPDVFIYHAVVLESGQEVEYTGDITLIR